MPTELHHESVAPDKQKAADARSTEGRMSTEGGKGEHEQNFFNRNLGVLITAATTILGISLSATQIWVAYIQSDREAQRRAAESSATQLEKSREFDFQESKDLREFVIKNYPPIPSATNALR